MSAPIRILGIDPGSRAAGYGVIEVEGRRERYVDSGVIRATQGTLPERLALLFAELRAITRRWQPDEAAIEKVFMHRHADAALRLGQARGAAICALSDSSPAPSLFEYSPNEIKQAVTGKGHATKEQVQWMVRTLLGLSAAPPSDAADALACALCHAHRRSAPTPPSR